MSYQDVDIVRRGYESVGYEPSADRSAEPLGLLEARLEPDDFLDAGDRVVVLARLILRTDDGIEAVVPVLHVWSVVLGEAVLVEHYELASAP